YNDPPPTRTYTLSLHDALPIYYTMNSFVQDPNSADAIEIMETFNKENKAGYNLSTSGGLGDAKSLEVNINTKEGSSTMKYEKMSDRKSTRLNSSHVKISYAVFC